jgi:putative FmdB family regulatory protein
MPIYAYRCATCGHAQDVLQKMSDDVLTVCPACGAATYQKQVTAAGFQLKGSGWYVTDFRGGNTPASAKDAKDAKDGAEAKPGAKPAEGGDKAAAPPPAAGAPATAATAAPAAAPAPAPAAAAPPPASGS